MKKIYALYKGDKFISVGTKREISEELNISMKTLDFYHSPSALHRNKNNYNNSRILIEIEEDE